MKKLFSYPLYEQGLKRIRTAGTALAVVVATLELIIAVNSRPHVMFSEINFTPVYKAQEGRFMISAMLLLAFTPLLSYLMFSFLNKRSSADFYHAIPHKRTTVYINYVLALFTWLFGTLFIVWGVSIFVYGAVRGFAIDPEVMLGHLALYVSAVLAVASATVLAVMLTGTAFSALYTSAGLIILPLWSMLTFENILLYFYPCVDTTHGLLKYFGAHNFIIVGLDNSEKAFVCLVGAVVLGLLWLVLGGIGYARRPSEVAGKATVGGTSHVFISLLLPFMLCLSGVSFFMRTGSVRYTLCLAAVGIAAMLVYELLTKKRFKKAVTAMPWLVVAFALSCAVGGTAYLTGEVLENNVPDISSEVESVSLTGKGYYYFKNKGYIEYPVNNVKDKAVTEWIIDSIDKQQARPDDKYGVTVLIKLKNGKKLWRQVDLRGDGDEVLKTYVFNTPELNVKAVSLTEPTRFENDIQKELWGIFKEEYYSVPINKRSSLWNPVKGARCFTVIFENDNGDELSRKHWPTKELTPKTYEFMLKEGLGEDYEGF